jgi:cell division protein FtsQ
MLVSAAAIYGLAASSAFGFGRLQVDGLTITPADAVRERLGITSGQNLFTIATEPLEARVAEMPEVAGAEIEIGLPDTLAVHVDERKGILVWRTGDRRFLVDGKGFLFADLGESPPAAVAELPEVIDERADSLGLRVSSTLDAVDLDAATRLASLTPADVGSSATDLTVRVTDVNGFVVGSVPESWTAVFGSYLLSVRTPDLIDDQVQLLAHLLAGREASVATVILADARVGTYTLKSPGPSAAPKP